MMHLRTPLLTIAAAMIWSGTAQAQMFAPRTNNQVTSGTFPGGAGTTAGTNQKGAINPNSRFVRTGRDPDDFVGTDSGDRRRFVGARQPGARRPRTLFTLVPKVEPKANQAGQAAESNSATSLYPPRLALSEELSEVLAAISSAEVASVLQRRLERSRALHWYGPMKVSVEGRTAILRGTVASSKERVLAELLTELEPGISSVRNDLQVRAAPETIESPPPPSQ